LDHGVDLLVWASLKPIEREIMLAQREPVLCPGGLDARKKPRRQLVDKTTCDHDVIRPDHHQRVQGHRAKAGGMVGGIGDAQSGVALFDIKERSTSDDHCSECRSHRRTTIT
jgi:hypothetical protein